MIPELEDRGAGSIRIPPGLSLPLTSRVRALIDSRPMRRLARVSQLGLVALVYPGAVHGRLEHSLGVYRLAIAFLERLRDDPRFKTIDSEAASAFLAAALLHDVGHWAYCHPIEDMHLAQLPRHESLVRGILLEDELAEILREAWGLDPGRVASLIDGVDLAAEDRLLASLLSGPVDVDKMDYLARDSLHAGVPYGRHFDEQRLLASLCVDADGERLAITEKGVTAAELLVFARYVMFSEVYWHHTVRAATAMLQRAVWLLQDAIDPESFVRLDDAGFTAWILEASAGGPAKRLVSGIFGPRRMLWKRLASFDARDGAEVHRRLSGRPYPESVAIAHRLAGRLGDRIGMPVEASSVLVDAPPAEREVEFRLDVRIDGRRGCRWRNLEAMSPAVRALAHEQFDELVKRSRIFVPPEVAARSRDSGCLEDGSLESMILEATNESG